MQKTVFDTTVKSHASIRGISAAFTTALRNTVAYVNSPLFFPMQFDWRGRLYYRTGFSPSQYAFTRSLINFSEPILIKAGSESEYFFFVALAKAIKKQDPSSYQKYFDIVLDHQEDILESLTNFYWVTFDEPFIALNLIQNFNIYIKHNSQNQREKGVLLYVKVEWDASASIFQISSALMANADTARLCNLLPSSHLDSKLHPILDIYKHLLPTYQENVHSAEDGLKALLRNQIRKLKGKQKVDHNWTEKDICLNSSNILIDFLYNLDRKTIKRLTMTKSYGKGTKGIQKDFIEHFIWLERLNNLKILKESNQDLNTNLLFIDFTKTSGLVKKRNWIKLKIDSKILKFKTFHKVYTVSKQIIIAFQGKADEAQTKNKSFYNELLPLDLKNTTQIKKLFQDLASLQLQTD